MIKIYPHTQEAFVDDNTFNGVCEFGNSCGRNTAAERTGLFSGLTYYDDCCSKLYLCASENVNEKQDFPNSQNIKRIQNA